MMTYVVFMTSVMTAVVGLLKNKSWRLLLTSATRLCFSNGVLEYSRFPMAWVMRHILAATSDHGPRGVAMLHGNVGIFYNEIFSMFR